jgi:Tfp pilus assembly protein PilO
MPIEIDPVLLWEILLTLVILPTGYYIKTLSEKVESVNDKIEALEKHITDTYHTKDEAKLEHEALQTELYNIRRLVEKLFDKIDEVKDNYVSHVSCKEFRRHDEH